MNPGLGRCPSEDCKQCDYDGLDLMEQIRMQHQRGNLGELFEEGSDGAETTNARLTKTTRR